MNIDLSGRKALVCGSSQGIGAAIAKSLAFCGAKVLLVARDEKLLQKTMNELKGDGHSHLSLDFSRKEDIALLLKYLAEDSVDIVINNTGGPSPGPIMNGNIAEFEKAFQMHLFASHQIMQTVLPAMKEKGFGRFVNVISTSVKIPISGLGVSNTTRGAMASWAKTLSLEVAAHGITVNNILPGLVETSRLGALIKGMSQSQGGSEESVEESLRNTIPAGRFGQPEELGYLAAFLSSDMAAYINGVSIPVDGGRTGSI